MSDYNLEGYLEFAKGLAAEASVIMRRYFRAEDIGTNWKEDNTPLTIADTTINKLVIDRVKAVYPDHGVIGEEDSYETKRDYVWVVDPIDGTMPFSLGIPVSTFCLALVYKGDVQVSVVMEPFQDRLFSAIRGHGAYLNEKKLKVSKTTDFKNNYFFLLGWIQRDARDLRAVVTELEKQGARMLGLLSYAYSTALVATGDLMVSGMSYGSPWDAAAIALIVEEAGGKATDLKGKPRKYNEWSDGILISNGAVHDKVVKLIRDHADTWN